MSEIWLQVITLVAGFAFICGGISVHAQGSSDSRAKSDKSARSKGSVVATARAGETLAKVAERLNMSADELARVNGLAPTSKLRKGQRIIAPRNEAASISLAGQIIGKRIKFVDGFSLDADEVWKQGDDLWYRRGNTSNRIAREVRSVEPIVRAEATKPPTGGQVTDSDKQVTGSDKGTREAEPSAIWIHLVGGARVKVDEVIETNAGAWYRRANLSIFLERERIALITREQPGSKGMGRSDGSWTSGTASIDELIKTNGARFGVDPYLLFCVIEHESHFHTRAVSPKGARGLMQLMPGTARRFGVSRPFDPAENIMGGTQYLRELMDMFGGQVNLVLASYNAGEGAVVKYGRTIPPYRETREYVKRISKRYGQLDEP
jgi:LysM repeat protein